MSTLLLSNGVDHVELSDAASRLLLSVSGPASSTGDGAAIGTGAATSVGRSTALAQSAATGAGAAIATGASLVTVQGVASGTSITTGIGRSTILAQAVAASTSTVSATGFSIGSMQGAASGTGAATAVGTRLGAAVGTSTALAIGFSTALAQSAATGLGAAAAFGTGINTAQGSAAGTSAASAPVIAIAIGAATGTGAASGVGRGAALVKGSATGTASGIGIGMATFTTQGTAQGSGVATGIARSVVAKGQAYGFGFATAGIVVAEPLDVQSYTHLIRDAFYNNVTSDPYFAGYTIRKNKMLIVHHELLPYLGVYIIDEPMTPDGDSNAGNIRFVHMPRIGFSVMIANNDQDACEQQLDAVFHHLELRLWGDPYLTSMLDTWNPHIGSGNPNNIRFEGIERGMRRYVWGNATLNNQTPVGELQYDITVKHRSYAVPGPFDDLDTIDLKTGIKPGDTPAEMAQRQQFHAVYKFDQSSFAAKRESKRRVSK